MDYATTYPNPHVRCYASGIVLLIDSNATYLVMPNPKSRTAGHFQLNNYPKRMPYPEVNGVI